MSILIGTDPELKVKGGDASHWVRSAGAFGCDGYPVLFEMRPAPAKTALEVVTNLKVTLDEVIEAIPELRNETMWAGHYKDGRGIGGHIHISGLKSDAMLKTLNKTLQVPMRCLSNIIDNLDEREKRERQGWGANDTRKGSWRKMGGGYMEFREPGSWLLSPHTAFMNLWLPQAIAEKVVDGKTVDFKRLQEARRDPCRELILFAEGLTDVKDGSLFVRTADTVFSSTPLDWDASIWEEWL